MFSLPRIDDLINKWRDATYITNLDLRLAYNQVRMSEDGPSDDPIVATAIQGLTPNSCPCLLEMLVMEFSFEHCSDYFHASCDARTIPVYELVRY